MDRRPAAREAGEPDAARPARALAGGQARRGRSLFLDGSCSTCHTIRGTTATGNVGPDLTHLQTRETLAALTIPNEKADLAEWVLDPQHVKPGNKMPGLNLSGSQLEDLLAYLESLK